MGRELGYCNRSAVMIEVDDGFSCPACNEYFEHKQL